MIWEHGEAERKVLDRRKEVKNDPKFDSHHDKHIGMMTVLGSKWNGHPGHMTVAKDCIEQKSD